MTAVKALDDMLRQMSPDLSPETYFFTSVQEVPDGLTPLLVFQEDEGVTVIVTLEQAQQYSLHVEQPMSRITLRVHSALEGVGLTAAFSNELAEADISCNVVAGFHHDHIFVPTGDAQRALRALLGLSARHRSSTERQG